MVYTWFRGCQFETNEQVERFVWGVEILKRISEQAKWGRREGRAEVDHSYLHYCQDETFPHLPRLQALYLGNKRKSMPG